MNHLAHVVLAGEDDRHIVGALLGDFWRGAPDPAWPPALAAGVRLHRRIDSFTDSHALQRRARELFDPPWRRYAGIVLDVWFDHLLARDFERLAGLPLGRCAQSAYTALARETTPLPPPFGLFAARLARHDGLSRYAQREALEPVFERIGARLSRANPIAHALPVLESLEAPLQRCFEALWPELVAFAAAERLSASPPSGG